MSDRPTPETTGARRVNHFDSSLPRYIVGVEVAERLERQRDELLDDLAGEPRATPETDAAASTMFQSRMVTADFARHLERQRDELLDDLAVIRTVASYPHHPNALSAIRKIAAKAIAKATGREIA